jgi:hypothetical protein
MAVQFTLPSGAEVLGIAAVFAKTFDASAGLPRLTPDLLEVSNYRSRYRDIGDDVRL